MTIDDESSRADPEGDPRGARGRGKPAASFSAMRTLTSFLTSALGFDDEGADAMLACDVADHTFAALRAFGKLGFRVDGELPEPVGNKARMRYDLVLTCDYYDALKP